MEWVVSFMPRPLWPRKKEPPVSIPCGSHTCPDALEKIQILVSAWNRTAIPLLPVALPVTSAVPALSSSWQVLAPCVFADVWQTPPAPRFVTPQHFWWVWVSSVRYPTAQACPLATSKVTSSAATDFPFIISETQSLIIRQRLICAVMRHLLSPACRLLKARLRLRYRKEQNRPDLRFKQPRPRSDAFPFCTPPSPTFFRSWHTQYSASQEIPRSFHDPKIVQCVPISFPIAPFQSQMRPIPSLLFLQEPV
jgi:hypothetical protein